MNAEFGMRNESNAECGMRNAELKCKVVPRREATWHDAHPGIPHSAFHIPH